MLEEVMVVLVGIILVHSELHLVMGDILHRVEVEVVMHQLRPVVSHHKVVVVMVHLGGLLKMLKKILVVVVVVLDIRQRVLLLDAQVVPVSSSSRFPIHHPSHSTARTN